jgi:hypothetical protein
MRRSRLTRLALLLMAAATAVHAQLVPSKPACIDEAEYERLSKHQAELQARFDLPAIAQEILDVGSETEDLKQQANACPKSADAKDEQACDALVKRYKAKRIELNALIDRFYAATDVQQYLLMLKSKLERPRCGK